MGSKTNRYSVRPQGTIHGKRVSPHRSPLFIQNKNTFYFGLWNSKGRPKGRPWHRGRLMDHPLLCASLKLVCRSSISKRVNLGIIPFCSDLIFSKIWLLKLPKLPPNYLKFSLILLRLPKLLKFASKYSEVFYNALEAFFKKKDIDLISNLMKF